MRLPPAIRARKSRVLAQKEEVPAQEASKLVKIGDSAVFEGAFSTNGDYAFSKAMDNRAGVYVLIKVLKEIKESPNDLYFAFTVQEEIGCRGARVCANSICPDIALAVGFSSYNKFSIEFKKHTGKSATQYLKDLQT